MSVKKTGEYLYPLKEQIDIAALWLEITIDVLQDLGTKMPESASSSWTAQEVLDDAAKIATSLEEYKGMVNDWYSKIERRLREQHEYEREGGHGQATGVPHAYIDGEDNPKEQEREG